MAASTTRRRSTRKTAAASSWGRSPISSIYGYDLLPLALRLLGGEQLPPRTTTQHVLVTAANVFRIYPPIDMN
jgi:hypothetical protein